MKKEHAERLLDAQEAYEKTLEALYEQSREAFKSLRFVVNDVVEDAMSAHCTKCGDIILGDTDALCGNCA